MERRNGILERFLRNAIGPAHADGTEGDFLPSEMYIELQDLMTKKSATRKLRAWWWEEPDDADPLKLGGRALALLMAQQWLEIGATRKEGDIERLQCEAVGRVIMEGIELIDLELAKK
jgi:hypothetical protein